MNINTNFSETYEQAVHFYQMGQLDRAKAICLNILSARPKDLNVNHFYGLLCYETGDVDTAIKHLKKTTSIQPKFAEAHSNLGNAYQEKGKLDKAVVSHRKALSIKSNVAEIHHNLGRTLALQGKLELAISSYRQAIKLKPDYFAAHNNLGNALKDQSRFKEAAESFRKALAINPRDTDIYNNLSAALLGQEEVQGASTIIEQWLSLSPEDEEAHYMLAKVLAKQGKYPEAIQHLHKAISRNPEYIEAYCDLGDVYMKQSDEQEALSTLNKALELDPENALVHARLGKLYSYKGDSERAKNLYKQAIKLDPDIVSPYIGLSTQKKIAISNTELRTMEKMLSNNNVGDQQKTGLAFALAKMHEQQGAYETSFKYFEMGNKLKRDSFLYDKQTTIELFDAINSCLPDKIMNPIVRSSHKNHTPVFIVGMPRSGTTLTEQILASHPEICGAGEMPYLQTSLSKQFNSNNQLEILVRLNADKITELAQIADDYMNQLVDPVNQCSFITNKLPHNFQYISIILSIFPDAKIIHCKRDPMDTCLSIYKHTFEGSHLYAYDLKELGQYYLLYADLMQHWHNVYPGRILDIKYEEIVEDQEKQTRIMLEYCGLEWDEACLSFHKTRRLVNTASAAQVREPIYKGAVGFWHHYETQLEPLRETLGYQ